MAKYINLDGVAAGCSKIDKGIDMYQEVERKIANAASLLGNNNLSFGDIGSSLEEQLDILKSQVEKCSVINEGITATIMSNAQAQYQEYRDSLEAKKKNIISKYW